MFPTELFSQLSVAKTSSAEMLEGGAAGTVNMRMARPFDNEGTHLTYSVQGIDNSNADGTGARGSLIASGTWGAFGALVGVAGVNNKVATTGFETVGWASMASERGAVRRCGRAVQHHWRQRNRDRPRPCPATPARSGRVSRPDAPIDQAFLLANNPGRDDPADRQRHSSRASVARCSRTATRIDTTAS